MTQFQLAPSSLTDAMYDSVRARIINGDIAPGEKLTEQRIAQEYGVARPTAKACIERLTALGLLRRSARKTAVVPTLDADDITDLFDARIMLECHAVAALASRATVPTPAYEAHLAMHNAVERSAFTEQVRADIAFHMALVTGVGSERLGRMYEMIAGECHLAMGQYQAHRRTEPSSVEAEHQALLVAITAGDGDAAAQAMTLHLTRSRDRVLAQQTEQITS